MYFENDVVIKVENVSKSYGIYNTPNDRLKQFVLPKIQKILNLDVLNYYSEFMALKDISFQIKRGESVGIIGRNGSGKSTLLQILCGTLSPNNGNVDINGRVAALLELGTGFNPEYTGRDNVYMNANILGLTKKEIDDCYDNIISFADIGDFINQPVKIYSSGMYVRLAFAVIAHVNADILIIDEALAVGDAFFTQKCMRFLRSFMENGTVIFVSHDSASVRSLCSRAIWLNQGRILQDGSPKDVCDLYYHDTLQGLYGNSATLNKLTNSTSTTHEQMEIKEVVKSLIPTYESKYRINDNIFNSNGWKTGSGEIYEVRIENLDNTNVNVFEGGEKVRLSIHAKVYAELANPILSFILKDKLGQELFGENTLIFTNKNKISSKNNEELTGEFIFKLPILQDGIYTVMTCLSDGDLYNHIHHHYIHDSLVINVYSSSIKLGLVGISFDSISLKIN